MSRIAAIFAVTSLAAATAHAAPDELCVPEPVSAGPAWWNPGLSPAKKEARWYGALVRKLSMGGRDARLRALFDPTQETVSFEVLVAGDPSLDAVEDTFLLALGDATGSVPELFIRFAPLASCPDAAACGGAGVPLAAGAITYSAATPSGTSLTWGPLSATNPSPSFIVEAPWVSVAENAGTFVWKLSFALSVPVVAGGEIRPELRVYGNAVAYEPGFTSGTFRELPLLCTSSSVTSNDCLIHALPQPELPFDLPLGNMTSSWSVLRSDCD
jgi:hypothetical protein